MINVSRKTERKLSRKLKKNQHALQKDLGIVCSTSPTKNIAVCNAGLVNGLSQDIVAENFTKYGTIENIIMLGGKSYCFVIFKELDAAIRAHENINGKLNIAQDGKPLYLLFSETIPTIKCDHNFNKQPPGLVLLEDFISEYEETQLLNLNDFKRDTENQQMKHRKVKHYGYEFIYGINNINKNLPLENKIPNECSFLWSQLKEICPNLKPFEPDQLTVNCYHPGQGIPLHVDTHSAFEDPIISLSLGASIVMDFKNADQHLSIVLPKRSLLILSGESRYNWNHGIVPRLYDVVPTDNGLTVQKRNVRVSFTFRRIRKDECGCIYTKMCDSYLNKQKNDASNESTISSAIDQHLAVRLENTHVHGVYDNVAEHFSETRSKHWPGVVEFLHSLNKGSVLVDVGCGNGKYLNELSDVYNLGCDRSGGLLDICKSRGYEVFSCNCLYIPLKDQTADAIISIAVIHHLATENRRLQALKEIVRVLRIDGEALIYVWAKDQMKNDQKSSYLKQNRKNRKEGGEKADDVETDCVSIENKVSLPVHTNRKQFRHQDLLVPWKTKTDCKQDNLFLRYYHVFEEGELENLCKTIDGVEIIKSYYDQGNWCIRIIKKNKIV